MKPLKTSHGNTIDSICIISFIQDPDDLKILQMIDNLVKYYQCTFDVMIVDVSNKSIKQYIENWNISNGNIQLYVVKDTHGNDNASILNKITKFIPKHSKWTLFIDQKTFFPANLIELLCQCINNDNVGAVSPFITELKTINPHEPNKVASSKHLHNLHKYHESNYNNIHTSQHCKFPFCKKCNPQNNEPEYPHSHEILSYSSEIILIYGDIVRNNNMTWETIYNDQWILYFTKLRSLFQKKLIFMSIPNICFKISNDLNTPPPPTSPPTSPHNSLTNKLKTFEI